MSRLLLLLPFILWMAVPPSSAPVSDGVMFNNTILFVSAYFLLVLGLGLWSRLLSRRIAESNLHRSMRRFNHMMFFARLAVPLWFATGMYFLDWKEIAGPMNHWPVQLPAMLFGTLPALFAWVGLWWAQYPSDRAMREQSLLLHLEENLPLHAPPGLRSYVLSNLRLQLLFTIVPVLFIVATRDVVIGTLIAIGVRVGNENAQALEALVSLGAAALVFIAAPEILKRVLHTQPLPPSALRDRLESICRRFGLGFRDILLWHTENNMGNAAVMGVAPQVRYILMSDLLLETMTDEQIEAVFAHEVGHIVHWHMAWYVVFFLILMSMLTVLGAQLPRSYPFADQTMLVAFIALFVGMFGFLSRKFERQADVFAARTMETTGPRPAAASALAISGAGFVMRSSAIESPPQLVAIPSAENGDATSSHVGPYGAAVFSSALERVAIVNNIPISGRNWTHGSIAKRMGYLHSISNNPAATERFDRTMFRLYATMLVLLSTFGVWAMMQVFGDV